MKLEINSEKKKIDTKTIMLKVGGLHCESCASTLRNALSSLEGVRQANVDFNKGRATVEFNPEFVDEEGLRKTIENVGYKVR